MPSSKKVGIPTIYIDSKSKKRYVKIGGRRIWLPEDVTRKNLMKFLADRRKRKSVSKKKKKPSKKVIIKKKVVRVTEPLKHPDTAWASRAFSVNLPNTQGDRKVDEEKIMREVRKVIESSKPPLTDGLGFPKEKMYDVGIGVMVTKEVRNRMRELGFKIGQEVQNANEKRDQAEKDRVQAVLEKEMADWKAAQANLKAEIPKLEKQYIETAAAALKSAGSKRKKPLSLGKYLQQKADQYGILEAKGKEKEQFLNCLLL